MTRLVIRPGDIRLPHSYNTGSKDCPDCGRQTPVLADGTFRRHRPQADTFAGPHCPAGTR